MPFPRQQASSFYLLIRTKKEFSCSTESIYLKTKDSFSVESFTSPPLNIFNINWIPLVFKYQWSLGRDVSITDMICPSLGEK